MKNSGLYWHVHHENLWEYCYDVKGRIEYIKKSKPKAEIKTRIRLMKPIMARLGDAKAWAAYAKAGAACDKARAAYDKARAAWGATIKPDAIKIAHAKECPNCPWNGNTIFP
jgi:hypothetical protein